jgi:hypothetical protein
MGVSCSPDIFQAKISELMATLEFVKAYIDDLLCITKGDLDDHLAELKLVNPRKYSRFLHYNTAHLSVKELRRFLGMVQYYRDLWAKRSGILAP